MSVPAYLKNKPINQQLKLDKMRPTQDQIRAAETVFAAMAYTQSVRPIIEKIEKDILEQYRYKWDFEKVAGGVENAKRDFTLWIERNGEYCSREFDTYLISDADFGHYLTEKHARVKNAGFDVAFGYCPLLIAASMEREAKNNLLELMQPVTGIKYEDILCSKKPLENLRKYVDLTLRYLAPFVKDSKQILAAL